MKDWKKPLCKIAMGVALTSMLMMFVFAFIEVGPATLTWVSMCVFIISWIVVAVGELKGWDT